MSDQSSPQGWPGQPPLVPAAAGLHATAPVGNVGAHPLRWARMPAEMPSPPVPQSSEEALALMERSHAATIALLPKEDSSEDETKPLSRGWFEGVREACVLTGRVPGVERMLFEWWINDPPIEGLTQLPWLFGVWQGHWVCWAGTTPWAAADLAAKSTYDEAEVTAGVQFGADPDNPPTSPWPPFGTAALAVPTTILLALSGKPAPKVRVIPATPLYVAPLEPEAPPPPPAPVPAAVVVPEAEPVALAEPIADTDVEAATEPDGIIDPDPDPDPDPETETETETETVAEAPIAPIAPIEAPPQPQSLPPAGWHPDPSGRHALRYWDGATWTAHAADPGTDTLHDPI